MGVGPDVHQKHFPQIIDQLASQGITNSRAFSLDLRSVDNPAGRILRRTLLARALTYLIKPGSIIFGGIDTMKYTGPLEKCPIIPAAEAPDGLDRFVLKTFTIFLALANFSSYWIYMTSVGITKPGESPKVYPPTSSNPNGQGVFLDSGSTISHVPTLLFNAIVSDFPGATPDSDGLYIVDCVVANQPGTVDFGFGNTIIHVPYSEFIWRQGTNLCKLGIYIDDNAPVLGGK
jgi:hypothetical protein